MKLYKPAPLTTALFFCLAVISTACSSTGTSASMKSIDDTPVVTLLYQDHPLTGKIWSTRENRFVKPRELVKQLAVNDYILLGETHDNPIHHAKEAWVIDRLSELHTDAGVAFEMIDDQQSEEMQHTKVTTTDQLITLLNKDKTGWDYDPFYRPVFNSVFKAGYPIFSANISRKRLMSILSNGKEQLSAAMKKQLDDNPLTEKQRADMAKEITQSHCGMSTPSMNQAMILGQTLRDATMSNSLFDHRKNGINTMVLVAGSGHIRNDRGIPHYLHSSDKNAKILTIAWIEVYQGADKVNDYASAWGSTGLPFDYIWFTPQAKRPDPCEEMREFMEKHKKGHGKPMPETKTI